MCRNLSIRDGLQKGSDKLVVNPGRGLFSKAHCMVARLRRGIANGSDFINTSKLLLIGPGAASRPPATPAKAFIKMESVFLLCFISSLIIDGSASVYVKFST